MSVMLDLRDERGRWVTRVKLSDALYEALEVTAQLAGITFDELVHRAIQEKAERVLADPKR